MSLESLPLGMLQPITRIVYALEERDVVSGLEQMFCVYR